MVLIFSLTHKSIPWRKCWGITCHPWGGWPATLTRHEGQSFADRWRVWLPVLTGQGGRSPRNCPVYTRVQLREPSLTYLASVWFFQKEIALEKIRNNSLAKSNILPSFSINFQYNFWLKVFKVEWEQIHSFGKITNFIIAPLNDLFSARNCHVNC